MKINTTLVFIGGVFTLVGVGILITAWSASRQSDAFLLLIGMGLVFFSIGFGLLFFPRVLRQRRLFILQNGRPLQAKVVEIRRNITVEVNGKNPWVIVAEFRDLHSAKIETAVSHNLWTDPSTAYPRGSMVTIFYLPDRPKRRAFKLEKLETA